MLHVTSRYLGWSVSPSEGQFTAEAPRPRCPAPSGQTEVQRGEGGGPGLPVAIPTERSSPEPQVAFHLTAQQDPWKSRRWPYEQHALAQARPALDHCEIGRASCRERVSSPV